MGNMVYSPLPSLSLSLKLECLLRHLGPISPIQKNYMHTFQTLKHNLGERSSIFALSRLNGNSVWTPQIRDVEIFLDMPVICD